MRRPSACAAAVITAALAVATPTSTGGRAVGLAVNGRSNANASIAARDSFVAIAWGASVEGGTTDIYVATSHDGGRTLGSPTRVNDPASSANLSGEQPPRVTLIPRAGRDPSVVVVWTAKAAAGTRLLSARMATTGVRLAPEAAPSPQFALLAATGFIALASGRVPPMVVILASAFLGPLLRN